MKIVTTALFSLALLAATPDPSGVPLWQIGDPSVTANTGQCGVATYPMPTSVNFVLAKNPGCMRNQLNPVGNGGSGVYLLNAGQSYTFNFQTVTHMGIDTGKFTQRLIWQVHDYACGSSPLTVLGIQNMAGGPNGQTWYMQSGDKVWTAPYTEGATDTWKITVVPSTSGTGSIAFYRNGILVGSASNINTFACGAKPWWNLGVYQWNWAGQGSGVSSLTQVEILFNYAKLTSP